MLSNELISGFVWALVILAVQLRLSYSPLKLRTDAPIPLKLANTTKYLDLINDNKLLWLLFILALSVRAWSFGNIPAGFNQDGAMAAVDAKALADYGTDRYGMKWPVQFTAWGYGQMSVLLSYLMIPFIKIGGLNEITARLPMLVLSMFGLAALYGFIKNTFNRSAGLIVLFLAVINPWHIMQSRWAIDCNAFPHLFIIGCYLLGQGIINARYLYLSMVSFALCMYCYGVAFFTVPLFLLFIAAYTLLTKKISIKNILISIGIYSLISMPGWLVMAINFLRLPTIQTPIFTLAFFPDSVRSGDILFFSPRFSAQLHDNIQALLNTTILQRPDLPWNALDNFGTQYQFALPLVLLGVGYAITKLCIYKKMNANLHPAKTELGIVIILCGVAIGLWTGFVIAAVNVNRINIIYYFLIILAGLGLHQLLRWFKPAFFATGLIYIFSFYLFCVYYFGTWSKEIGAYFFAGMGQALHQAAKIDTPKYYVTVNSQYTGARNVSEILTLFHHKIDAKYFQGVNYDADNPTLSSETIAGNKYAIPYSQRYVYIDPRQMAFSPEEKAVYIVKIDELHSFDQAYFDFIYYQDYVLVTPKSMHGGS